MAGAAGAAGLAGVGMAWRRYELAPVSSDVGQNFWSMEFKTLAGKHLSMRAFQGRPLVLNFWATWCPPCVDEMPLLNRFYIAQQADWQVLGLAVDQPGAVAQFLARSPVAFPVAMAGLEGVELSKSLGNQGGGLPFTLAMDAAGRVQQRKMGKLSAEDLASWRV